MGCLLMTNIRRDPNHRKPATPRDLTLANDVRSGMAELAGKAGQNPIPPSELQGQDQAAVIGGMRESLVDNWA